MKRINNHNMSLHHVTYDENYEQINIYPLLPVHDESLEQITTLYEKWNIIGKMEAIKRLTELTETPEYIKTDLLSVE